MNPSIRQGVRLGLISVLYFAAFNVLIGIPAYGFGGRAAAGVALAVGIPLVAVAVILLHGRRDRDAHSKRSGRLD